METNKMTDEKPSMLGTQFFGTPHEESKECAMVGLIKNQMNDLEEDLYDAKIKFADATLDKDNWSMAKEREITCKVIEGQISMLTKLQNAYEEMLSPIQSPMNSMSMAV